jgi:hypothetical protein
MDINLLIEKVHAIKCSETTNEEVAMRSLMKLSELKENLLKNCQVGLIEDGIANWRNEYPYVSNEVFNRYEKLKNP